MGKTKGRPKSPPGRKMDRSLSAAVTEKEREAVLAACRARGVKPSTAIRAAVIAWAKNPPAERPPDPGVGAIGGTARSVAHLARLGDIIENQLAAAETDGMTEADAARMIETLRLTRAALRGMEENLAGGGER